MDKSLNLVLLGGEGAGKSASGNTILGQQAFKTDNKSVKPYMLKESGTLFEFLVTVHDTTGFCDPKIKTDEVQKMIKNNVFQKNGSCCCAFLLVIKAERFTEEEKEAVEKIEKILGEKHLNQTWILITRGDQLENDNKTIKEFLNENESLNNLIQKYDQRYHVFANKTNRSRYQVKTLLTKIVQISLGLKASHGGRLSRKKPAIKEADDHLSSRRIVLLGKTGVGKSAAGNTLLGKNEFKSEISGTSVTKNCSEKHGTVSDREVFVVDTPGFYDTEMETEELEREIARSVYISSPGPHAFLIVFPVNMRFTVQEQQIPQMIEMMFGEEVLKYTIILFTHGDQLENETPENIIKKCCSLRHLVQECGGRYHVFNNKNLNGREQVNKLMQKIDTMNEQNGGGIYSNEMFEDALRLKQKEQKREEREKEERKIQEKQRQEEADKVIKEIRKIKAEIEAKTSELEGIKAQIQNEEVEKKLQETQIQDEDKRVKNKRKIKAELEGMKAQMQKEEAGRKLQDKQREEEAVRARIFKAQNNPEFKHFFEQYKNRFKNVSSCDGVKLSILYGAICGAVRGSIVGAPCALGGAAVGAVVGAVGGAVGGAVVSLFGGSDNSPFGNL